MIKVQHGEEQHDADFDTPFDHRLPVQVIVPSERIVQDICEVDEDRVERGLALDGPLFLSERRGTDFVVVYIGLKLLQDL